MLHTQQYCLFISFFISIFISRPVATAIAGIDPSEVSALGIPVKKIKKTSTSSALSNYELANKLKKTYGLASDGSNRLVGPTIDNQGEFEVDDTSDIDYEEKQEGTEQKIESPMVPPPPSVAQVGMMLQPDLDPYSLIPQQYHNMYNIKPPHHMIMHRHSPIDINADMSEDDDNDQQDDFHGESRAYSPQPVQYYRPSYLPYFYMPYQPYYFYRY